MKKEKKQKAKINIKEMLGKVRVKRLHKDDYPSDSKDEGFSVDSFGAMVHSTDPILRLKDEGKEHVWTQDLLQNISCAALMTAVIALFCMSIDSPMLAIFALPCFVVYMAVAIGGSIKTGPVKWVAGGVVLVILIALAVIWRSTVLGGLSMLMNQFYDYAEEAQAYIYTRLPGGDEASEFEAKIGIAWVSCVIGLITALPMAKTRRRIGAAVAVLIMLGLAYYGLLPSAICIGVIIAAMIAAFSRGNFMSLIPVILAAVLIFTGIVMVDPGENYAISRMDENFRDRFALRSALLETGSSYLEEEEEYLDEEEEEYWEEEEEEYEETEEYSEFGDYAVYGIIALVAAALGAGIYLVHRRISKRIAANRKGIDSKDTREAVTAMFPYALRWLKGYGIEQPSASAVSMAHNLEDEFSESYADRFRDMYVIWSEAAYSDHDISEESRSLMETFVKDTVKGIKDKCKLRDKLRLRYKYAL